MKTIRAIAAAVLAAMTALATPVAGSDVASPALAESTGSFFALSTANHDVLVGWYTGNLGFRVVSEGANDERRGTLLSRDGALLEIADFAGATSRSALAGAPASHEIHGIFKLGFVVAGIDRAFAAAQDAGLEIFFPVVDASGGFRTFGLKDPDGNIVQFFER